MTAPTGVKQGLRIPEKTGQLMSSSNLNPKGVHLPSERVFLQTPMHGVDVIRPRWFLCPRRKPGETSNCVATSV